MDEQAAMQNLGAPYTDKELQSMNRKQLASIIATRPETWPTQLGPAEVEHMAKSKRLTLTDIIRNPANEFRHPPKTTQIINAAPNATPASHVPLLPSLPQPASQGAMQAQIINSIDPRALTARNGMSAFAPFSHGPLQIVPNVIAPNYSSQDLSSQLLSNPSLSTSTFQNARTSYAPVSVIVSDPRVEEFPVFKRPQLADVTVKIALDVGGPGRNFICALELMMSLQQTHAAIPGRDTVQISYSHDQTDQSWHCTFCTCFRPEDPKGSLYNPPHLRFPPQDTLYLEVIPLVANANMTSKKQARRSTGNPTRVAWVKKQLEVRPGWKDFQERRNKQLNRTQSLEHWKFACACVKEYSRTRPKGMSKINAVDVYDALGIGSTWYAKVARAYEIYEDGGEALFNELGEDDLQRGGNWLQDYLISQAPPTLTS
ncbi:hypothetical protein VNI00_018584 [Paramarasmius palmivorus]|uniref:Uncharacterized protein n=1 Tax=Paramarasmius palmivorus TaxID=297713 RepID=A0AAW0AVM1_9AGAR